MKNMIDRRKVCNLYWDGKSKREIAGMYDVSVSWIAQIIKKANMVKPKKYPTQYKNFVNFLKENKITQTDVATWIDVEQATLSRKLSKQTPFKIDEIKIILKETGKTFEYLFEEEDND